MKLEITDALGQAPTYPVLVQLALGGPQHGQVILDPDGNRIACNVATFIWHDRDDQGNLIAANEEFEIGMGTLSSYVGVAPDPVTPGQVVPVWGTAELLNLSAQAKVQINGAWADPLLLAYGVHPEPGKPDHFFSFQDRNGHSEDDHFEYWSGFELESWPAPDTYHAQSTLGNAYVLGDHFENVIFGQTATSATCSATNVTVAFHDQTTDRPDYAAYTLTTAWTANPSLPDGRKSASVSVNYAADPGDDWGTGTVTKPIWLDFHAGTDLALVPWQDYDRLLRDHDTAADTWYGPQDGTFPLVVSPRAEGKGLPTTCFADTPRLVLLMVRGTAIYNPMSTPWPDPHNIEWSWDGTTFHHQVGTGYDPRLEVAELATFRLTLVDATGAVAKDGAFRVRLCPRFDHEGPVPPAEGFSRSCPFAPADSSDGVIESVIVNPSGSADGRGYLGVELTRAPANPGSYFILVESTSGNVRVKDGSQLSVDFTPDGVYSGGLPLCTVE